MSCLLMCLLASPAFAGPFDGRWELDPASCGAVYSEARVAIADDRIGFVESACRLTNPTAIRGMDSAVLYDMECSGEGMMECSGEGMTWSERILLARDGEAGLLIYSRGFASRRQRCPES
ncbi:hypothetical protein [Rhodovulum adriaticum]|nr:hypothetical protein [Rhodovulum adriaticum]